MRSLPRVSWVAAACGLLCSGVGVPPPGVSARQAGVPRVAQLAVDLPAGWQVSETRGTVETYEELRCLGPRNADDTYTAWIAVRARPLAARPDGTPQSADAAADDYLSAWGEDATATRATAQVAGLTVPAVGLSYTIPPLHRRGLHPVAVPVASRTVFLVKGASLYELSYSADAREFAASLPAFDALLRSARVEE